MTVEQRQQVRKLRDKLCIQAEKYKGVDERACAHCESPCNPGMELLKVLGIEQPESWMMRGTSHETGIVRMGSMRRIVKSTNKVSCK